MSTYYIASTGNDTTGNGTQATPWKTLNKAYLAATTGDTILIADGLYQEDSGGGYLYLGTRGNTDYITIQPVNGANGDVTIQGTTATASEIAIDTAKFVKLNYLKFTSRTNATTRIVRLFGNASNIQFNHCTFTIAASGTQVNQAVMSTFSTGANFGPMTFDSCTFQQSGSGLTDGIYIGRPDPTATVDGITVRDCGIILTRRPLRLEGTTNVLVDGNRLVATDVVAAAICFALGIDGPVSQAGVYPASGKIIRNIIQSVGGHACLIGAGVTSATVQGNVIIGGSTPAGQGLVIKEGSLIEGKGNLVFGGYQNTLYIKGAQSPTMSHNVGINLYPLGYGLHIDANLDANGSKFANATCLDNYVVSGTGTAILYGPPANEIGSGSVVDRNVYDVRGTAVWGTVRGTTVSSLATVQTAWTGYASGTNDDQSLAGVTANTTNYRHTATAGVNPAYTGPFLYRVITDRFGNVWDGTAFVPIVADNWYQYAGYLVEPSLASYFFTRGVPLNLPPGDYKATLFSQSGAGARTTDTKLESQEFSWDGSQPVRLGTLNTGMPASVWSTLTSTISTTGSVGNLLKAFLVALGVDNRPKISADTHTAGATIAGLSGTERAALTTMILTDTTAANQQAFGSLGNVVRASTGITATGKVNDPDPGTGRFLISLDPGQTLPPVDRYKGQSLCFTGGNLVNAKKVIASYQRQTAQTAEVTFVEVFDDFPEAASPFQIM